MKRSRLVLALILVAVVVLVVFLWVDEGPLWRWVVLTTVESQGSWLVGDEPTLSHFVWQKLSTVRRDSGASHGTTTYWYVGNGFKAGLEIYDNAVMMRSTRWSFDGHVQSQSLRLPKNGLLHSRFYPPWLWGVTDQTEPTAPWWGKE